MEQIPIALEDVVGCVAAHDIVDPTTREVLVECNQEISQEKLDLLLEKGVIL